MTLNKPKTGQFLGQKVLVTGGARGIGAATAAAFADEGADVILADLDRDAMLAVAGAIGAGQVVVYDQADPLSIASLAEQAGPIDILVNNAGMLSNAALLETDEAELTKLIHVDLLGPVLLTRRIGAGMVQRQRGVIVNVSSQLAFTGAGGRAVYSACKAAISHFTGSIAAEWGPLGVRVVAVAPGRTETRMTEAIRASTPMEDLLATIALRRYGQPTDIADAIVFLASAKAAYITGTTLIVDGGYLVV